MQEGNSCWGRGKTKYNMANGVNYTFTINLCCDSSFSRLAHLQHNGPYVPVGLQRESKEWGPITVLPPVLLGDPLRCE